MGQQGIYVAPCNRVPNINRADTSCTEVVIQKLWIIEFELFVSGSIITKGCAVVKAKNASEATTILTKDGIYNATPNKYSIIRVAEIVPSPSSMLLCEQINDIVYD